jgi:Tfp pilus assembly protein PilV
MKATTALRVSSSRDPGPSAAGRTGISLFEVVLSLVILVSTLAAIGQLISSGGRGAVRSRLLTQGVFLAESLMAEMISGAAPLASQTGVPFPDEPRWTADVTIESEAQADLYLVTVRVQHQSDSSMGFVNYELSRLVRDPGGVLLARSAEEERVATEEEEATARSSQSSSQSNSGQSGSSSAGGAAGGAGGAGANGGSASRNTGTSGATRFGGGR